MLGRRVFVFVLSEGNVKDAKEYIKRSFLNANHTIVTKKDLVGKSSLAIVKLLRQDKFEEAFVFSKNLDFQSKIFFLSFVLLLTGAHRLYFVDPKERYICISRMGFLFKQIPCFLLESLISLMGVAFIVVLACILKLILKIRYEYLRKVKVSLEGFGKAFLFKERFPNKFSNNNKKVLFLRTEFAFQLVGGGSVTHINGIAKGLEQNGCQVRFISNERMENVDYPTEVIPPSSFLGSFQDIPQLLYNFRFFFRAMPYIKEFHPSFLYFRHDFYALSVILLSWWFRLPLVLENNGVRLWNKSSWGHNVYIKPIVRLIEDVLFLGCDQMVVVSDVIKEESVNLGVIRDKIVVVPNAVDIDLFHPAAGGDNVRRELGLDGKIVVTYCGSFMSFHGLDVLKDAMPTIFSRSDTIYFIFVGDGALKPDMEKFVTKNGWKERVFFTGCIPLREVPRYLDASDIVVAPYKNIEGGYPFFFSPVKQFEYMAMGKGIVASDIGQTREILRHEYSALLVEPENHSALAEAILRLANDETLRQYLGKSARTEALAKHTWQKNVETILKHQQ